MRNYIIRIIRVTMNDEFHVKERRRPIYRLPLESFYSPTYRKSTP